MNQQMNPEQGVNALDNYGINLTRMAKEGKIDTVIGREDEIRRMVQILSRRKKNNPVLIGEPGTGKTTVVEGLAKRIIEGDVPENIKNKQLIALDLSAMVAGAMYRGQFEERLKNFVKSIIESAGEIILFIDELHMIVGAGNMEGQMDVANMIKPELARGRMKVIGATTLNEYQKYIEKDAALERRFQQVYISEPNVEDTITILRGIKDKYELHHKLNIRDSALISAAILSDRYISDRFLPDKAVDLVDEAASKIRMEINSAPVSIDNMRRKLLQLEVERVALKNEKDSKSKERLSHCKSEIKDLKSELDVSTKLWKKEKQAVESLSKIKEKLETSKFKMEQCNKMGDLGKAAEYQYKIIPDLENELNEDTKKLEENKFVKLEVTTEDIAEVVSKWTGIPLNKMLEGEKEKLLHLEEYLKNRVVGQEEALKKTSDVIRMSKMGVVDIDRPLGSFLFMGNTGVGKTELAKTLAEALFDSENALVRIDMSELMEPHSVSKLIGAPPGYVGYDEGGILTEAVRRRPYQVVLFDEIEKAHADVFNILFQVLDDGRLTDGQGRTVDFRNTIIVLTSNLGGDILANQEEGQDSSAIRPEVMEEVKATFRPEFINRLDEIILFHRLFREHIAGIVDIQLDRLAQLLANKGLTLELDQRAKERLAQKGYDPTYGARPLRRVIQTDLQDPLASLYLEGGIQDGDRVKISATNDGLTFSTGKAEAA